MVPNHRSARLAGLLVAGLSLSCTSLLLDNQPPVAFAGFDQRGIVGEAIPLNGVGSYDPDGDRLSYRWVVSGGDQSSAQLGTPGQVQSDFVAGAPGRYMIQLTVNDGTQDSPPDFLNVFVMPAEDDNRAPVARAGSDQTISLGSTVLLDGSGSTDPDGDTLTYAWRFASVPAASALTDGDIADAAATGASFAPDAAGGYTLSLTVSDGRGGSDTDGVLITAQEDGNTPPEAQASAASPVTVGGTAVLDGSASSDPDGDALSYAWSFTSVPAASALTDAELLDRSASVARFVPDVEGDYRVSLLVDDGRGGTDTASATVTARSGQNRTPEALAQSQSPIMLGDLALLDGSASSDPDGDTLTYTWSFTSLPQTSGLTDLDIAPNGSTIAISSFEPDVVGTYEVSLLADDGRGATDRDQVSIVVETHQNRDPVAEAGDDVSVMLGEMAYLDGRASSDADGDTISYSWSFDSVAAGSGMTDGDLSPNGTPGAGVTSFQPDVEGAYVVRLTADDGLGGSGEDTVTVTATVPANRTPTADAGSSLTVQLGNDVTLDGRASFDPDGDPLAYAWSFAALPGGTALTDADIADSDQPLARFAPDVVGQFRVALTVDDGRENGQDTAEVVLTVTDVPNGAPTADAGSDQTTYKNQAIGLDGSSSSDPDGDPLTYHWSVIERPAGSGVGTASFSPNDASNAAMPLFTPDRGGTYRVQLLVEDGKGGLDTDEVLVTATNRDPAALAGTDRTAPKKAAVILAGSGSDPDSDPLTYAWRFVSKPALSQLADIDLSPPSAADVEFTPDHAGDYEVELEVTDNDGGRGTDTVLVRATNMAPTANAGEDVLDAAKGAPLALDGSASDDPENDALTYAWVFFTVPAGSALADADIVQPTTARPRFTPDATGTYILRLTVTDEDAAADSDDVVVSAVNQDPVADAGGPYAGPSGQAITLTGSGTDPDGDTLSYFWSFESLPAGSGLTDSDIQDRTQATARFTPDVKGEFVVSLRVMDTASAFDDDMATVTSQNNPPLAVVSAPGSGFVDEPVALDGSGSSDPDGDALSYTWWLLQAPASSALTDASISNRTTPGASFTPDVLGVYQLRLTVQDTDSASDSFDFDVSVAEGLAITTGTADLDQARECVPYLFDAIQADYGTPPYSFSEVGSGLPADLQIESDGRITGTPAAGTNGIYPFTVEVHDFNAETAQRDLSLQVLLNRLPHAEAGDSVNGQAGTRLTLSGSGGDDDGNTLTYTWRFVSRAPGSALTDGDIQDAATDSASFVPDAKGSYVLELRVDDGCNGSATDTVTATATNRPPTADIVVTGSLLPGEAVNLDGRGCSDPDGDSLTYLWTFDSVPAASALDDDSLSSPNNVMSGFVPDMEGTYVVRLAIDDGDGGTDETTASAEVAPEPLVITTESGDLPAARECVVYAGHTLQATGGTPPYGWQDTSGNLSAAGLALGSGGAIAGTPDPGTAGTISFTAEVTDQQPTSTSKGLQLLVEANRTPTASAGSDQTVPTGAAVTLVGSASSDPDGNTLAYSWSFDLKPVNSALADTDISDRTSADAGFTPDVKGVYVLRLTVTDGCGGSHWDTAKVTAANRPPTADAGPDDSTTATGTYTPVALNGMGSSDPDGDSLTYVWSIGGAEIAQGVAPVVDMLAGVWTVDLMVDDGDGGTDSDSVQVTVAEPASGQSAAYVAKPGNDAGNCTRADPCDTITRGLNRAGTLAINNGWSTAGALVAEATYNERFTVWSASSLYCGFESSGWTRDLENNIVDITVNDNAGVDFEGGTGRDTVVEGCRFHGRHAGDGNITVHTMRIDNTSPTLRRNLIETGEAAYLRGVWINGAGASPLLEGNAIYGGRVRDRTMNDAENGRAVVISGTASPTLRANYIAGPDCNTGGAWTGNVRCDAVLVVDPNGGSTPPLLERNQIYGASTCGEWCYGVRLDGAQANLFNNLITGGNSENTCALRLYLPQSNEGLNPLVYHNVILGGQGNGTRDGLCLVPERNDDNALGRLELIANIFASASHAIHEYNSPRLEPALVWNNDFHVATLGVVYRDEHAGGADNRDLAWVNSHFDAGRAPANIGVAPEFLAPNYADPPSGDWHLQLASQCVDQGAAETVDGSGNPLDVPRDFDGQPREADDGGDDQPDIGLDEVY